ENVRAGRASRAALGLTLARRVIEDLAAARPVIVETELMTQAPHASQHRLLPRLTHQQVLPEHRVLLEMQTRTRTLPVEHGGKVRPCRQSPHECGFLFSCRR